MRNLVILLIFFITIPLAIAEIDILDADRATLDLTITGDVSFVPTGSSAQVSDARAYLSWYPRETYNQRVEKQETSLEAEGKEELRFTFIDPQIGDERIWLEALISTNNDITPITTRPHFPINDLDADLIPYTQPSQMIDYNEDIGTLAGQLAAGKNDQYEVVFVLADWVTTNIHYNLSTLTADAIYPSSWVLEQRYGVCDEMTNLFISLNRALGIPARFVSGLAYTEMPELENNWGGHGWAEVYFPEVGWVPFDVTYGEYGYIDSGHIKLKDSIDSRENSVEYQATGYGFKIESQALDFDVDILGRSPRHYDYIKAEIKPFAQEVAFGSYNLIELHLENLRDYYVSTRVELGETTQIGHENSDKQNILLKPHEEKTLYFLVKVDENLDSQYIYTFPITAYTKLGSPAETSFKSTASGPYYSKEIFDTRTLIAISEEAPIDIICTSQTPIMIGTGTINCTFTNTARSRITGEACIDVVCDDIMLASGEEHTLTRAKEYDEAGIYTIAATFRNDEQQKTHFVTQHVFDQTEVQIIKIKAPSTMNYEDEGVLTFAIERTSASAPKNTRVTVEHPNFSQEWESRQILTQQEYILKFYGSRLRPGSNTFSIITEYDDPFGNWHTTTQEVSVELVDLTLGQRVVLYMDIFDVWLGNILNR